MTLYFCYVPGISLEDTPYLGTYVYQRQYFETATVATIETTFYPPHYRNQIKLSSSDIDVNTRINYLFFDYKNRRYYYFIDSITYLNEDVIAVDISMDVIQTYMFSINVHSGVVERKFIDRWNDNLINRDYIRENVTKGEMLLKVHKDIQPTITDDYIAGWLIFRCSDVVLNTTPDGASYIHGESLATTGSFGNYFYVSQYIYYAYPVLKNISIDENVYIQCYYNSKPIQPTSGVTLSFRYRSCLNALCSNEATNDVFFMPGNFFGATITNYRENIYNLNITSQDYHWSTSLVSGLSIVAIRIKSFTNRMFSYAFNFETTKQSLKGVTFDGKYLPQLLDDNYYRISFGETTNQSSFPLYYLTRNFINYRWWVDILTGNRYYQCYSAAGYTIDLDEYLTEDNFIPDEFNTIAVCDNPEQYDIISDSFKQWYQYNKASIIGAGVSAGLKVLSVGASAIANNSAGSFASEQLSKLTSDPNRFDKRYKKIPTLKKRYEERIERYSDKVDKERNQYTSEVLGGVGGIGSDLLSLGISALNAYLAPDGAKSVGNWFSDLMQHSFVPQLLVFRVQDYEACANYFHRMGYRVDELVPTSTNIFEYVQNRYYFNILKMRSVDIHVNNAINTDDLITAITDRLTNGIRLWNVSNSDVTIGDYTYDNVELSALS